MEFRTVALRRLAFGLLGTILCAGEAENREGANFRKRIRATPQTAMRRPPMWVCPFTRNLNSLRAAERFGGRYGIDIEDTHFRLVAAN